MEYEQKCDDCKEKQYAEEGDESEWGYCDLCGWTLCSGCEKRRCVSGRNPRHEMKAAGT